MFPVHNAKKQRPNTSGASLFGVENCTAPLDLFHTCAGVQRGVSLHFTVVGASTRNILLPGVVLAHHMLQRRHCSSSQLVADTIQDSGPQHKRAKTRNLLCWSPESEGPLTPASFVPQ